MCVRRRWARYGKNETLDFSCFRFKCCHNVAPRITNHSCLLEAQTKNTKNASPIRPFLIKTWSFDDHETCRGVSSYHTYDCIKESRLKVCDHCSISSPSRLPQSLSAPARIPVVAQRVVQRLLAHATRARQGLVSTQEPELAVPEAEE